MNLIKKKRRGRGCVLHESRHLVRFHFTGDSAKYGRLFRSTNLITQDGRGYLKYVGGMSSEVRTQDEVKGRVNEPPNVELKFVRSGLRIFY